MRRLFLSGNNLLFISQPDAESIFGPKNTLRWQLRISNPQVAGSGPAILILRLQASEKLDFILFTKRCEIGSY